MGNRDGYREERKRESKLMTTHLHFLSSNEIVFGYSDNEMATIIEVEMNRRDISMISSFENLYSSIGGNNRTLYNNMVVQLLPSLFAITGLL